jgi:hypothetical protein
MFDVEDGSMLDWVLKKGHTCHGNMRTAARLGDGWFKTHDNTKSGDHNTTSQNTTLCGAMGLYDLANSVGCFDLDVLMTLPFRIIVMGDDSYTVTIESIRDKLGATYAELGIKAKPKKVTYSEGTFCSSIFVPSSHGTLLTPLPGRMFTKLFWSIKKYGVKKAGAYCHAVSEGMLNDFAHVPFMNALFKRLIEITPKMGKIKSQKYPFHSAIKARDTYQTYDYFSDRYNLTRRELEDLETFLASIDDWQIRLDHPVINRMVEVDVGLDKCTLQENEDDFCF